MVGCSIRKCSSRSVKGGSIRFFSFPVNELVANEWLRYCGPKTTVKNGRVCSNHFLSSDYIKTLQHVLLKESPRKLRPDVVPTLQTDDTDKQNARGSIDNSSASEIIDTSAVKLERNIDTEHNSECDISNEVASPFEVFVKCEHIENLSVDENGKGGSGRNHVVPLYNAEKSDITLSVTEYKSLKKKAKEYDILKNNLEQIFTAGQIRCLMKRRRNKRGRVRWSAEDIAAAISLRSVSPKGYRHLRATVGIPLPGFSTICKWTRNMKRK